MNPQKAHSLGIQAADVEITTQPLKWTASSSWIAWVPDEERGKRILTQGDLFSLCQWRAQLARFNAAQTVYLPELLSNSFGISRSEARRCLAGGGVRLDGVVLGIEHMDILTIGLLRGRKLRLGKRQEITL